MTTPEISSSAIEKIHVNLADRSYMIHVGAGLIGNAGHSIAPILKQPKTIIVTDKNVAEHWLSPLQSSLADHDIFSETIIMEPGEQTKCFAQLEILVSKLLNFKIERDTIIIALGGGVIGDLTGMAAAITLRGIDFIQIPTTLLAQVDSSVGGKTGINTSHGKNLAGAFHQPKLVLADTNSLQTLPLRELKAGYAELVKYGLIGDADFFEWLEENGASVLAGHAENQQYAILKSCQAKADIVANDEFERGQRALLNFGHTFGHAFEAETGYCDKLLHGEAVAIGSVMALEASERLGLCPKGRADRLRDHFTATDINYKLKNIAQNDWKASVLLDHMRLDKKVTNSTMVFILAHDIGDAFVTSDIKESDILAILNDSLEEIGGF
jgi:3-dehydroquinate synthase